MTMAQTPPQAAAIAAHREEAAAINGIRGYGYAVATSDGGPCSRYQGRFHCDGPDGLRLFRQGRDGDVTFSGVLYGAGAPEPRTLTVSITRLDVRGRSVYARFSAEDPMPPH